MQSCLKSVPRLVNKVLRQIDRKQHHWGCLENKIDFHLFFQQTLKLNSFTSKIKPNDIGFASMVGRRKTNEDRFKIKELGPNLLYFAIYDGHGGSFCAEFCKKHMETVILKELEKNENNLPTVLEAAFFRINCLFSEKVSSLSCSDSEVKNSGTTATVCLLKDDVQLVIAHVGDSQALLCRNGQCQKLTIDHNSQVESEKERILKCGGLIYSTYFGNSFVNSRLMMTRSIGDLDLKPFGVTSQPDIKEVLIDHKKDSCIILTTDGISNVLGDQELIDLVNQNDSTNEAATLVADQALHYSSEDNVTILVVPCGAWKKFKNYRKTKFGIFGKELYKSARYCR